MARVAKRVTTGGVRSARAADDRDLAAEDRDRRAEAHDDASDDRDQRADARDERSEAREQCGGDVVDIGAVADRAAALRDREGGCSDRTQAADDRKAASSDRILAAKERAASSIDGLTRAYRRDAGTLELTREIARAKRKKQRFVLAFIDVDDLKGRNDSLGHPAGDQLLRETAAAIKSHIRSYDLLIRFGGDEFVCGLPDMTVAEAAERFSLANTDLRATQQSSVSVGFTELEADDTVEDLITRADAAMYSERQQLRGVDLRSADSLDIRSQTG